MKAITLLVEARKIIATNWCTFTRADRNGNHCALGALDRALVVHAPGECPVWCDDDLKPAAWHDAVKALVIALTPEQRAMADGVPTDKKDSCKVAIFNNTSTHEEVLDWFDLTIARQLVIDSMVNQDTVISEPVRLAELTR